jgi:organic radical activating enzyme
MLEGERPKECEYCWKIEDLGPDNISDRVHKSVIYSDKELAECKSLYGWDKDVDLKTLEIAFDPNCNFGCSYCNASFSTTWQNDIKKNWAYQNLVSDGAAAFQHDGGHSLPYGRKNEGNPYIEAFWKWWDNGLSKSLQELRITGGEPLMSANTWKLLDWFNSQDSKMRFAVNSNLIAKDDIIDKLIEKTKNIHEFHLYTSCEATGDQAEYIRDGLDYTQWKKNLVRILSDGNCHGVHIMMTINSLCLFSITDFLDEIFELKKQFGKNPTVSVNLLRFPSFQSPLALPDHIKDYCRENLEQWFEKNKNNPLMHEFERASIERLIDYLITVDAPHRRTSNKITLWRDFKSFYQQYDQRRGKTISVFPDILTDWLNHIPETKLDKIQILVDGNSTKQYEGDEDLKKLAEKEGWVLNPDSKNIDKPTATYD